MSSFISSSMSFAHAHRGDAFAVLGLDYSFEDLPQRCVSSPIMLLPRHPSIDPRNAVEH